MVRLTLLFSLLSGVSLCASPAHPHGMRVSSLPLAAQSKVWAAVGRDVSAYHIRAVNDGFEALNSNQELTVHFTKQAAEVRTGNVRWRMILRGYGYGTTRITAGAVTPRVSANRLEYQRGPMTEWYVNGPAGLEQGFSLAEPPAQKRGERLTIALSVSGDLKATVDWGGAGLILTDASRRESLRYQGLTAFDATGAELASSLQLQGDQLLLQVNDTGARYPVTIDPWVQQAKLAASDGAAGDQFASSAAIDGDTIVVGAFSATVGTNFGQGAAYVFVEPSTGWADMTQTAKLTASDGMSNDQFGSSVSVSGGVVVVGAPYAGISNANCSTTGNVCFNQGAAYVYVEPSSGWADTTETAKLTASDGVAGDELGYSVGIDSSSNTVVAGAPGAAIGSGCPNSPCMFAQGAAYVFVEPASGWASMTQTGKLTASHGSADDGFGQSVSISGTTAVVGAPYAGIGAIYAHGAAYVYAGPPPAGWSNMPETAELTTRDGKAGAQFGCSVSISWTGIAVGALGAEIDAVYQQGAAYVYIVPKEGWKTTATATAKLTASDGAMGDQFGASVSIRSDTLVVGAPNATIGSNVNQGAGYVYVEPARGWRTTSAFSAKVSAADGATGDSFGMAIALSDSTLVVGAPLAAVSGSYAQGVAYVYQ